MATQKPKMPMMLRVHNATCPVRLLRLNALKKFEPGCRMVAKYEQN